jgi:UDP-N-acetylglucosamine 2-epimerase
MKIVTIIGARPQFIKAAPFSRFLRNNYLSKIEEVLVHTGQHYDTNMSDVFFSELEIPLPKYNLGIGSGEHGYQTGKMLMEIERVLLEEKSDLVIVYGDTNSTIAGSLAASKIHIPVAHIEAGLRSFNMLMPEELNRIVCDHISNFCFCPTETAVENLKKEGIFDGKNLKTSNGKPIVVRNTGDIMFDAILYNKGLSEKKSVILSELDLKPKTYVLATVHRAENTDNVLRMKNIFDGFSKIPIDVILTLHPRTKKYIKEYNISIPHNVKIIDPVGYLDMIALQTNASVIMTDSGGVQKEAFFLRVPCITLRDETEWVETLKDGWNTLAQVDNDDIADIFRNVYGTDFKQRNQGNYFGDGESVSKIVSCIIENERFN